MTICEHCSQHGTHDNKVTATNTLRGTTYLCEACKREIYGELDRHLD